MAHPVVYRDQTAGHSAGAVKAATGTAGVRDYLDADGEVWILHQL